MCIELYQLNATQLEGKSNESSSMRELDFVMANTTPCETRPPTMTSWKPKPSVNINNNGRGTCSNCGANHVLAAVKQVTSHGFAGARHHRQNELVTDRHETTETGTVGGDNPAAQVDYMEADLFIDAIDKDNDDHQHLWHTNLCLNNQEIRFKQNTGSEANLIPGSTFDRMHGVIMTPLKCLLVTYSGHKI